MRTALAAAFAASLVLGSSAPCARADDDADARRDVEALRRLVESQDRRIRELEGAAPTQDEISAAVDRYLDGAAAPALVGGAEAKGSAGFPTGKRPFLKEGANRLEIGFRNQVRYEAFLYGDDARANAVDDPNPKDRSGFEVETLLVDFQGTVFCEDLTFRAMLNFDSDSAGDVEKRWMYLDWKYTGDHHVRAGQEKVGFGYEELNSAAALIFVDRNLAMKAFGMGYDTGVSLWGTFGDCEAPKRFLYRVQAMNGEGRADQVGSVFADATDKFSDQLLYAAMFEWTVTGKDWKWDEVDHRPCDERCRLDLSLGIAGYFENDDDANLPSGVPGGLAVKGNGGVGPLERRGLDAWVRAQWRGWSFQAEWFRRWIDFTQGSTAPDQDDSGAYAQVHHRFAESNRGVGAKFAVVRGDDDTFTGVLKDTMWEAGVALNYFFWDHSNKVTLDATRVSGNSGVGSTSAGYLVNAARGVVVEDGWLLRLQWQINL